MYTQQEILERKLKLKLPEASHVLNDPSLEAQLKTTVAAMTDTLDLVAFHYQYFLADLSEYMNREQLTKLRTALIAMDIAFNEKAKKGKTKADSTRLIDGMLGGKILGIIFDRDFSKLTATEIFSEVTNLEA